MVNPYASPEVSGHTVARFDREIFGVARAIAAFGWIGFALYVPIVVGTIIKLVVAIVGDGNAMVLLGASVFNCSVFLSFRWVIRVAARLRRCERNADRKALFVSCIMTLFFPLFTLIGIICIYKIRKHYPEFVRARCGGERDDT